MEPKKCPMCNGFYPPVQTGNHTTVDGAVWLEWKCENCKCEIYLKEVVIDPI